MILKKMNGKKAKLMRRMVKNSTHQSMNNQEPAKGPKYSLSHLESFVAFHMAYCGKKPESITVLDDVYNWYIQEINNHAESLGLKPGLAGEDPTFLGIKLLKKSPVVVPGQN